MRDVTIQIEGITPYSASAPVQEELLKGETKDAHEQRRWREKAHADDEGNVFIPGASFKLALDEVASTLNEKIGGKGNQTYTKVFVTGVTAMSDVFIGLRVADLKPIKLYCNADGKRGSGTRVWRWFPIVPSWKGSLEMKIFNDNLPAEIFERFFAEAGILSGVGRGRPRTGCPAGNGRFRPTSFVWS